MVEKNWPGSDWEPPPTKSGVEDLPWCQNVQEKESSTCCSKVWQDYRKLSENVNKNLKQKMTASILN